MVVISKAALRDFSEKHPEAHDAMKKWYDETKAAEWQNFAAMKQTFNSVDAIGKDRYVFNIKGNRFRLIALVFFRIRTVFILFIGTHGEYDKVRASTINYQI